MGTIAEGERNKMLDAWAGRTAYTANAAVYVKLHIGDPGAAGTANAAANTTRQQAVFGSAAASGAISNTAAIEVDERPEHGDLHPHLLLDRLDGGNVPRLGRPVVIGCGYRR